MADPLIRKRTLRSRLKNLPPGEALVLYYGAAILTGTLLLSLPTAVHGPPLSFLDAFFTATAAQCVTGLTVVDTGTQLTLFGQLVVLVLIQIGGIGIMTFSVFLFIHLRAGVSLRGRWVLQETLLLKPVGSLQDLVRGIFLVTVVCEGVGAALLAVAFVPELGLGPGLYAALFHSVSAFCNAGFSLFPDSLVGYRGNGLVNLTVMALVVLGGIGFLVIQEVTEFVRQRGRRNRLSLHTRLVLLASAFLIISGAAMIAGLEADHALAGMPFMEGFWTALFHSVAARSAGFNTLDLNAFHPATLFLFMLLMFIGASPGSAGGGIKTTTFALFLGILYNRLKGSPHTNLFRRTVPDDAVTRALSLVLLAFILIGIALFALLAVQSHLPTDAGSAFLSYAFETVSAFGTVGFSMGATGTLSTAGKVIVIVLMFVGRVGLLTLAFAIARRRKPHAARYAEESVMIG